MAIRLSHVPGRPDLGGSPRRSNKFNAKRTNCAHGHVHDSGAEAARCGTLHLLQRAGQIRKLEQQPRFYFTINGQNLVDSRGHAIRITLDFRYEEMVAGEWVDIVEDVKSDATMTQVATLRMALFRVCHPGIMLRIAK